MTHVPTVRSVLLVFLLGVSGFFLASAVGATPRAAESGGHRTTRSRAVGSPTDGHLEQGMRITSDRHLYFKYGSAADERWGTEELVGLIQRSAARVAGAKLTVGDLSEREGGRMRPHLAHRNGRDVDLGFYLSRGASPVEAQRFIRVRADGSAGRYRFDDARNWQLVESMLTDSTAEVEAILVATHLERRLLAEARRQRSPRWVYERARLVMYQPRVGGRHDDHFHVRIHCPADDRPACIDTERVMPIVPPLAAAL